MSHRLRLAASTGLLVCLAGQVHAQEGFTGVGMRAQGMAGAFVAVADDPTAAFWNPAGLATGGLYGLTIEWTRLQSGNHEGPVLAGPTAQNSSFTGVGSWPLGFFYSRQRSLRLMDGGTGTTLVQRLETMQAGTTILQSLTDGVVLGATLKFVRGTLATGLPADSTAGDALDDGRGIDGHATNTFDFDIGLMVNMGRARVGLTSRNLREPTLRDPAGRETTLERQSRLGLAVLPVDGVTLAMDVDLDTVTLRGDLRRLIAAGGEARIGSRVMVRAGVQWDLEGTRQLTGAAGASVAIRPDVWIEGFATRSRAAGERGFGIGIRAGR
jgi:hypothetical protein